MALGLAGCMGQFFGKPLDQRMFLGELSLDGGVRPVRGALSAALAARDKGLKAIAVPEANAREAAVVDRIDIHIEVPAVKYKELRTPALAEDSEAVRARVVAARNRQLERYRGEQKTYSNAQMLPKMLRKHCGITAEGEKLLENAITRLGLSARAHDRILKVARTIADLEATENIAPKHLSEAIQYPPGPLVLGLEN
jgi:predicted ATPase with chaperone activity